MKNHWPDKYSHLNFNLPENLIAAHPVSPPDHARLMVIDRAKEAITHDQFFNLGKHLKAGDAIFYNATRVEERRVYLRKAEGDKLFECVFLKCCPGSPLSGEAGQVWQVLMRNIRRLKDGAALHAAKDESYRFILRREADEIFLESARPLSAADFARLGEMPIPPYMQRPADASDAAAYQNFFKDQLQQKDKVKGSAASPTAALHFTLQLYAALRAGGIEFHPVCLDIGYGTFAPLAEENLRTGKLHAEHYFIPPETAAVFGSTPGRKVVLGTTALRALLSYRVFGREEGETEIFIRPGDTIVGVDALITNFHLPQSSLILLTAAFCGQQLLMEAYREAIRLKYRFYSYGDAMLII